MRNGLRVQRGLRVPRDVASGLRTLELNSGFPGRAADSGLSGESVQDSPRNGLQSRRGLDCGLAVDWIADSVPALRAGI